MKTKYYIVINEFGHIYHHTGDLTPQMLDASRNGILIIIDVTSPEKPTDVYDNQPLTTFE